MKTKLDKYEIEIEKALEKGEYHSAGSLKETKKMFSQAAKNYRELQKSKRITIRIKQEDLLKIKAKAKNSGIPYQTLIRLFIHQYADSRSCIEF